MTVACSGSALLENPNTETPSVLRGGPIRRERQGRGRSRPRGALCGYHRAPQAKLATVGPQEPGATRGTAPGPQENRNRDRRGTAGRSSAFETPCSR